jgi:hypothetical protein
MFSYFFAELLFVEGGGGWVTWCYAQKSNSIWQSLSMVGWPILFFSTTGFWTCSQHVPQFLLRNGRQSGTRFTTSFAKKNSIAASCLCYRTGQRLNMQYNYRFFAFYCCESFGELLLYRACPYTQSTRKTLIRPTSRNGAEGCC